MPRVRFTVRAMMAAVAIAGVAIWAVPRAVQMRGASADHRERARQCERIAWAIEHTPPGATTHLRDGRVVPYTAALRRQAVAYYEILKRKYERAARSPWLPVEPDPPFPE